MSELPTPTAIQPQATAAGPGRVLVIEDDVVLRHAMVRGLARLPDVRVEGAGTLGEALAHLERATPHLILSDIDLPDGCGLALMEELSRRRLGPPVVFVSGYVRAFSAQLRAHPRLEVLEKPVAIDQLRDVVDRYLRELRTPRDTAPFGLADYMQLASLGRRSVRIEVGGSGVVVVNEGQVWSARDASGEGMDALRRLLSGPCGGVRCHVLAGELGPQSLSGSAEEVLLEAARLMDEAREAPADVGDEAWAGFTELDPTDAPPPSPTATPTDPSFEALCEAGLQASMARRHAEALTAFEAALALRPDDRRVLANVHRLQGLVQDDAERRARG